MKIAVLFIAICLSSCCATRTTIETRSYELPADTDTIYVSKEVFLPEAHSDSIYFDIKEFCDSINKPVHFIHSTHSTVAPVIEIDSLGIARVFCHQSFNARIKIDSLVQLNIKQKKVIEQLKTITKTPSLYNFFKDGFFLLLLLLSGTIYLLVKRLK